MAKKIIFSVLGISLVVVGFVSYKYYKDTQQIIAQIPRTNEPKLVSQISNTGSVSLSGDVMSGSNNTGEMQKNVDMSNVPLCEHKLNPITIIDMDKVVRNCTEKKKEGRTLEGLGGVSPQYLFSNGSVGIVLYDNNEHIDLLCKGKGVAGNDYYVRRLNSDEKMPDNDYVYFPGYQLDPMIKVAKKGILSELNYRMYPDSIYCGPGDKTDAYGIQEVDQDCLDMKESMATSDKGYYFVAGFRDDMEGKLLYVINDKVYHPGKGTLGSYDYDTPPQNYVGQGIWQFVTVKNNTMIVKRMKDEKINVNKKDGGGLYGTTYTLQTCEIPL